MFDAFGNAVFAFVQSGFQRLTCAIFCQQSQHDDLSLRSDFLINFGRNCGNTFGRPRLPERDKGPLGQGVAVGLAGVVVEALTEIGGVLTGPGGKCCGAQSSAYKKILNRHRLETKTVKECSTLYPSQAKSLQYGDHRVERNVQRFVELSIRKGSNLASLERHNPADLLVVLEAFLTYLPDDLISAATALTKAQEFLDTAGDWLNETPVTVLLQSLKKGLIFEATVGYRKNSTDRYTREALEEAVSREKERRETLRAIMQKALQQRNREINSRKRQTHPMDAQFMREAMEFAREAAKHNEVPVGCVIVKDGAVIGAGRNAMIEMNDPSAHAEVLAIRQAAQVLENYRLTGCTLYVTLEPCAMCAGLIAHARIARVVFAARDEKTGAYGGAIDLQSVAKFTHKVQVDSGILAKDASLLLTNFFGEKRHA